MTSFELPTLPPRLLMAGLSCVDHLWRVERFPPTASRTRTSDYTVQGGGPAATAAVAAARLGARTELWAVHGDDANGHAAREELRRYGVGLLCVVGGAGATSMVGSMWPLALGSSVAVMCAFASAPASEPNRSWT